MPVERRQAIPAITGVGAALPERVVTTSDVQDLFTDPKKKREVGIIAQMIKVKERHWVRVGEQASSDLGVIALKRAVDMAEINLSAITTLMFATSTQDYMGVPTPAILQAKLGLPETTRCVEMGNNACVGLLQALRTTFADVSNPDYGSPGPQAVLGVEVLSGSLPKAGTDIATMFADGGSALIVDMVTPDDGAPTKMGFAFGTDGQYAESLLVRGGGSRHFTTPETVAENMHVIEMDPKVIGEQAVRRMVEMANLAMERAGVTPQNSILIPHQANGRIMQKVANQLEFPQEQVVTTIDHTGNTSAASTGIALFEAVNNGIVNRNDYVVMVAFGAGLTFGALVFPMAGLPARK
ncbi:MAG: ketoacyl-ACP synthase III [Patescibacteria group bacterium]